MRIAIDARKINDFGIGTYLRNLLRHLPSIDSKNEFHALSYPQDAELLHSLSPQLHVCPVSARNYSLSEHWSIPWRLKRLHADLFHAPHYVLPFLTPCPSVVTVHDAIHLLFPQYLSSRFAFHYARYMIGRTLEHAKLVMTVSQASKRDLLSFFEVAEENILVIPNGIDPAMFNHLAIDEIDGVKRRFELTDRTALFVGNIKPHKNVERLITAFAKVREDPSFSDLTLVIVGDELSKYPSLRRAVDRYEIRPHVRFLGFVPEATLVSLYRAADVFVFPSLYEGFGLPPLEAMANGTPVVTSKLSSLPEVVGEAAVTVDPYNVDEIAEAIKSTLVDPELRARLIESGQKQAQQFSWETAAAEIHAVYMRALGLSPETSS